MNGELRHYLDTRFDALDRRLNAIDERITQNARERLQDVEDLNDRIDGLNGPSKRTTATSGGLAAVVSAFVIALFEGLRRITG